MMTMLKYLNRSITRYRIYYCVVLTTIAVLVAQLLIAFNFPVLFFIPITLVIFLIIETIPGGGFIQIKDALSMFKLFKDSKFSKEYFLDQLTYRCDQENIYLQLMIKVYLLFNPKEHIERQLRNYERN